MEHSIVENIYHFIGAKLYCTKQFSPIKSNVNILTRLVLLLFTILFFMTFSQYLCFFLSFCYLCNRTANTHTHTKLKASHKHRIHSKNTNRQFHLLVKIAINPVVICLLLPISFREWFVLAIFHKTDFYLKALRSIECCESKRG